MFEYLFRSPYGGYLPLMSFLGSYERGSLTFVSAAVRQLLVAERVRIPRGCAVLGGAWAGEPEAMPAAGCAATTTAPAALTADLRAALVKGGHRGCALALWDVAARTMADLSGLRFALASCLGACADDGCVALAVGQMGVPLLARAAETMLAQGRRALLLEVLLPRLSAEGARSLVLAAIEWDDVEIVRAAAAAPEPDRARQTTAERLFVNDAVMRAVRKGKVEALDFLVTRRGFPIEHWSERLADAARRCDLPMARFLVSRRGPDDRVSERTRLEAMWSGSEELIDMIYRLPSKAGR